MGLLSEIFKMYQTHRAERTMYGVITGFSEGFYLQRVTHAQLSSLCYITYSGSGYLKGQVRLFNGVATLAVL